MNVQGLASTFGITAKSVREAQSYSDGTSETAPGVPATEHAPAGGKLVVVTLSVVNTGDAASYPEEGNGVGVMTLLDEQGRSYDQGQAWASNDPIQPGMTRIDIYTFPVPSAVQPKALAIELDNTASGQPSTALLDLRSKDR